MTPVDNVHMHRLAMSYGSQECGHQLGLCYKLQPKVAGMWCADLCSDTPPPPPPPQVAGID